MRTLTLYGRAGEGPMLAELVSEELGSFETQHEACHSCDAREATCRLRSTHRDANGADLDEILCAGCRDRLVLATLGLCFRSIRLDEPGAYPEPLNFLRYAAYRAGGSAQLALSGAMPSRPADGGDAA
jgi:hypothetical protein